MGNDRQAPLSFEQMNSNVIQICLLLEGIGILAQVGIGNILMPPPRKKKYLACRYASQRMF
jgi:hypothetical protein